MAQEIQELIRLYMERTLDAYDDTAAARRKYASRMQAEGYRLVATYLNIPPDDPGIGDRWEITDATTGEVLASGDDGGLNEMYKVWSDGWYDVAFLHHDVEYMSPEPIDGLPGGLKEAIRDWMDGHLDEARALLGRPSRNPR